MRKFSLGACVALCALTAAATVSVTYVYAMNSFNEKVADVNQRQAMYAKLSEIDQTVRQEFVGEIDETSLLDGICTGYVAGLGDPDAKYLSAEKYKAYLSGTSGKSVGVGINTVKDEDGNMKITEVIPNSPGEAAGLQKGDVILEVNGTKIKNTAHFRSQLYKYSIGDTITLKINRDGKEMEVNVLLTRSATDE